MADIAAVFHWPPSAFADMSLADLAMWHAEALKRHVRPVVLVEPPRD